jgi:hypothetical protein
MLEKRKQNQNIGLFSFYLIKNSDVTFCALLDYPLSGIMIEFVAGLLPGRYLLARNSVNWNGNIF